MSGGLGGAPRLRPAFDRMVLRFVTRGWPPEKMDQYIRKLRVDDDDSAVPNVIGKTFTIIDTKATGLLTHASMMIAALGVSSAVVAANDIEKAVIILEIMVYLIIATFCLRLIAAFYEPPDYDDAKLTAVVGQELILRLGLYTVINRVAIYLTMFVFISTPILFLV